MSGARADDTPRRRWPWVLAAAIVALPLLALAGIAWVATTPSGMAWLLARVPGLAVTAPQGSLIGDFAAERVVLALPGGEDRILVDGLRWQGLGLARAQSKPAWLRVQASALRATRVEIHVEPAGSAGAPDSLASPVELALDAVDIGELVVPQLGEQPLRALHARIGIGADEGRMHRIEDLALEWDRIAVSMGSLFMAMFRTHHL